MSTTEARPVISDEEFDEDATVRLSDFNALKEMFHELKGQVRITEDGEDHGSDGAKEW